MSRNCSESSTPNEMGDKRLSYCSFHKILCNQLEKLENSNSVESIKTENSANDEKSKIGRKRVNIFIIYFD